MRVLAALLLALTPPAALSAQAPDRGRHLFDLTCARCHGGDGNGGERGPGIVARLALRGDASLAALVREGLPAAGMPGLPMAEADARDLVSFLRTLRPARGAPPRRARVETT